MVRQKPSFQGPLVPILGIPTCRDVDAPRYIRTGGTAKKLGFPLRFALSFYMSPRFLTDFGG